MDISMGKWVTDYDGFLLMKFTKTEEYQRDFLDGKLFFNTADFFAECDDRGRGDKDEGSTFLVNYSNPGLTSANFEKINGQYMLVVRDYSNNPDEYKPGTVWSYSSAENRNRKIISLYTCYVNTESHIVHPFPTNMERDFGEYGILILNRQAFFDRVVSAIKKHPEITKAMMGFVEYEDMKPGLNDWHPFRKDRKDFSYQNEFRITFVSDTNSALKLDLECTLRDIAVPVFASEIDEIHFEGENLLYPIYSI